MISRLRSINLSRSHKRSSPSTSDISISSVDLHESFEGENNEGTQTTQNRSSSKWSLDTSVLESVVKLHVTHCEHKYMRPWQMASQTYTTSSGFVLPNRLILTNAHSVEHYTMVQVKRRSYDKRYTAKVLAIGKECDLALLTVEDDNFWGCSKNENQIKLNALHIGKLPKIRDSVIVAGYPHGGDGISVTAGIVSRIELFDYTPVSKLLTVQIDAAINPGNSGGPVFDSNGDVVGVAFCGLSGNDAENIGYLVPPNVIEHFLNDVKTHGKYTGFCTCGFDWDSLECDAARKFYKLPENESGIYVRNVLEYVSTNNENTLKTECDIEENQNEKLMKNDIITHIDGVKLSNSGTIPHAELQDRILFHVLIAEKFNGDTIKLRVFRDGKFFENIIHKLSNVNEFKLIPVHLSDLDSSKPDYFIFGGLVFLSLTNPYLVSSYGTGYHANARIPVDLRWISEYDNKKYKEEQVVILSDVLNAEINVHYEDLCDEKVLKVNDTKVINLKHLYELITKSKEQFVKIELIEDTIILEREEAIKANENILKMHHIPSSSSFSNKSKE